MGQHANDAINDALDEEEYRANFLPNNEPINPLFEYDIPTEENVAKEIAILINYL